MNNVDFILDQNGADDVRTITSGILRFFSDEAFAGRNLTDHGRFRIWAASTASRARLIELADVARIKSNVTAERWANVPQRWFVAAGETDVPVGEVPPTFSDGWWTRSGSGTTAHGPSGGAR